MTPERERQLKQEFKKRRPDVTIGERLGEGSFSLTYDGVSGRVPCAIKFSREPMDDPAVVREHNNLLNLMLSCNGHPHIATLYYVDDNVLGHLATVWEKGDRTLEDRLKQCQAEGLPAIPQDELALYMLQTAEGLDYMHGKGFVHRDVKPENLLLFRGQVKLIDWGFARYAEIRSTTNSVAGTPVYAPPEANEERVRLNPAFDIYSLAATYVRLVTGQFPFGRGDDMRTRKTRGEFHRLGLSSGIVDVLRVALSPDPKGRRYHSASEFATALLRSLRGSTTEPVEGGDKLAGIQPSGSVQPRPKWGGSAAQGPATAENDRIFRDYVQELQEREAAMLATEKGREQQLRRQRIAETDARLRRHLDAHELPLAYATVQALLREDATRAEYQQLKQFLEQNDPRTGEPRCCDATGMRYSLILPGEFMMGSAESPQELKRVFPEGDLEEFQEEWPRHRVVITKPFYMAVYPTTVAQFRTFTREKGYATEGERDGKGGRRVYPHGSWYQGPEWTWHNPGFSQGPDHPVTQVSRNDAAEFLKWHRERTGWESGFPSEAEWEYACRAGTTTRHYAGDDLESLAKIANVADASAQKAWQARYSIQADDGYAYTSPVGRFAPNAWGLYDCLGNVWEWCHDRFDENYYRSSPTEDPQGPASGQYFVLRAGSWAAAPWHCRSECRSHGDAWYRSCDVGFRLCIRRN
jgi:sulfatase modifying factor 1